LRFTHSAASVHAAPEKQIQADIAEPEIGRETERDQRCEAGADQPGQIGGERSTGVADLRLEAGVHRPGGLAVRQAEQTEADEDEDVLAERAAAEQRRREAAEHGDQRGQQPERAAPADAVGDQARAQGARGSQHRTEHLDQQEGAHRLIRVQQDPRQRGMRLAEAS
jgi:hypothetical protein